MGVVGRVVVVGVLLSVGGCSAGEIAGADAAVDASVDASDGAADDGAWSDSGIDDAPWSYDGDCLRGVCPSTEVPVLIRCPPEASVLPTGCIPREPRTNGWSDFCCP